MEVLRLRKAFPNGSSANIKLSKTPLSKIVQLRGHVFGTIYDNIAGNILRKAERIQAIYLIKNIY